MKNIKKWHLKANPRKQNGKTFNYYDIAENYTDKQGKHQKRKIKYLGKLPPEKIPEIKLALRALNGKEFNLVDFSSISFVDSKKYLDIALLSHIYDSLGLGGAFDIQSSKTVGTKEVAKILTLSRCLDPSAKYKTVDWFNDSYLPNIMKIKPEQYNKDKILRELQNISKQRKFLQKIFTRLSKEYGKGEFEIYFFDGTTSFFEGSCCTMAEPGKDKTTGFQNKMILILLVTDKRGYPITWEVFNGRASEKTEIKKIIKHMADELGIKEVTFCFDRGFRSEANLEMIEDTLNSNSKYITGLDKNQIDPVFNVDNFVKVTRDKLIENLKEKNKSQNAARKIMPINGFHNLGKDRFYQDLGIKNEKRHIISFNMNIHDREKEARARLIETTVTDLDKLNIDLLNAKGDRDDDTLRKNIAELLRKRKLTEIIKYKIMPKAKKAKKDYIQTYQIEYEVDKKEITMASRHDGLLVYITDHTQKKDVSFLVPASSVVEHYKNKYVIEDVFRHIKSVADLRPFFVYLTDHVKAHVDICMKAYFIDNFIRNKLKDADISLSHFYSVIKSYSRVCTLTSENQHKTLLKTLSKEVRQIIKSLGASQILSKKRLEKLAIQLN